jgi:hypothetical protein
MTYPITGSPVAGGLQVNVTVLPLTLALSPGGALLTMGCAAPTDAAATRFAVKHDAAWLPPKHAPRSVTDGGDVTAIDADGDVAVGAVGVGVASHAIVAMTAPSRRPTTQWPHVLVFMAVLPKKLTACSDVQRDATHKGRATPAQPQKTRSLIQVRVTTTERITSTALRWRRAREGKDGRDD